MSQYFDEHPEVGSDRATVTLSVGDRLLTLATDRGVFSRGEIDAGTAVLLRKAPAPPETGRLLDLGCGYGPIALALASQSAGADVWAVDVNERALDLVAENAAGEPAHERDRRRSRCGARRPHVRRDLQQPTGSHRKGCVARPLHAVVATPGARRRGVPRGATALGGGLVTRVARGRGFPHESSGVEQGIPSLGGERRVKQLRSVEQKRLHRSWQRRTDQRVALLLDGVQDPFNVGSIVRTAAALRVEHLYLSANATTPTHPKVGKTALGTERYLEWTQHERVAGAADAARSDGFTIVGLELADESVPFFELDLQR